MYVSKTNYYTFTEEEKNTLRKAQSIFDSLSDNLLYSVDDYYELDGFNLNQDDIELISKVLYALVNTTDIITHDNIMEAD